MQLNQKLKKLLKLVLRRLFFMYIFLRIIAIIKCYYYDDLNINKKNFILAFLGIYRLECKCTVKSLKKNYSEI